MLKWIKKETRKAFMVSPETHKVVKIHCANSGTLIKEFIETAIRHELLYRESRYNIKESGK